MDFEMDDCKCGAIKTAHESVCTYCFGKKRYREGMEEAKRIVLKYIKAWVPDLFKSEKGFIRAVKLI